MVPARHAPSHEAHRRPNTGALFRTFEATDFPTDFSPDGMVSDHGQAHEPLNQPSPQRHVFAPAPAIRRRPVDDGPTPTSRAASSRNFTIYTRHKERRPIHFGTPHEAVESGNGDTGHIRRFLFSRWLKRWFIITKVRKKREFTNIRKKSR